LSNEQLRNKLLSFDSLDDKARYVRSVLDDKTLSNEDKSQFLKEFATINSDINNGHII